MTKRIVIYTMDCDGETRLSDGDKIRLQESASSCGPNYIELGLRLEGVSWWKGLQLDGIVLAQCQDNQPACWSQVSYAQFETLTLTLWKATAFGIHTPMYDVADAHQKLQPGKSYTFDWLSDQ